MSKSPIATVFVIESYEDFIRACRARRHDLALTQLALDQYAGLPSGYTAKVELSESNPTAKNARSIGRESWPLILNGLKAQLVLVPAGSIEPRERLTPTERARKGGEARWEGLTPEQRSEAARKAVQARWAKRVAAAELIRFESCPGLPEDSPGRRRSGWRPGS